MGWLPVLMQAAATLGNAALSEGAKRIINDSWEAVKSTVVRKFGTAHEASHLLDQLKDPPSGMSAGQIGTKLAALPIWADPDIARALEALSTVLKAGDAPTTIATAEKVYGAQVNHGSIQIRIGTDH